MLLRDGQNANPYSAGFPLPAYKRKRDFPSYQLAENMAYLKKLAEYFNLQTKFVYDYPLGEGYVHIWRTI